MSDDKKARIRELNDTLRRDGIGGVIVQTFGVNQLPPDVKLKALGLIREFDSFNDGNDPHLEHDFGQVEADGYTLFFKVDYYDTAEQYGSEDPSDPEQTHRVMTIMLAEEY